MGMHEGSCRGREGISWSISPGLGTDIKDGGREQAEAGMATERRVILSQ